MLTSKEVLEKTGVSRATLNNYISWGLVPRPDVLPPEPRDGSAPRIGYFADETVQRIEEIQRLKRDGWSITRIAEHFGADTTALPSSQAAPSPHEAVRSGVLGSDFLSGLTIDELEVPAYLVNDRFELLWTNEAARSRATWPGFARLPADSVSRGIFRYLLEGPAAETGPRKAVLRFHLGLAKQRGASLSDLCRGLTGEQAALLERLYSEAERIDTGLVAQARISGVGPDGAPLSMYAVLFREGILFLYVPGGAAAEEVPLPAARGATGGPAPQNAPALTEVAVVATDLQRADVLWSQLPAGEYFELVNQIWLAVDPIFRRHQGTHGKHPRAGMVCYFFPQPDSSYLWNAVLAAHQTREAIRRVSKDWQLRKGWTTELYMNTGIDEGLEWLGAVRSGPQAEFIVLGETVANALRISDFSRDGALWVTRNLIGKLRPPEWQQLKYGVRRVRNDGQEVFVPSIFSRVEHLAVPAGANDADLTAIARLPITEIVEVGERAGKSPAAGGSTT